MNHTEIRRRLSAYLDDAVSNGERGEIDAHLATCGSCRRALSDLKQTVGHLKRLPAVEPPPWLTDKIMAHVREAAKPSLWRRLFWPLRMKLPVEALALVFLCVTGYYLARTNASRVLPTAQPPAGREKAAVPASAPLVPRHPRTPSLAAPSPKTTLPAPRTSPTAPAKAVKEPAFALPPPARAPASAPIPSVFAPEPVSPVPMPEPTETERLLRDRREAERMASREREYAAKGMVEEKVMRDGERSSSGAAGTSSASSFREFWAEPPGEVYRTAQTEHAEQVVVTLRVPDPVSAVVAIEEAVTRSGGRIVRREYGKGEHFLLVRTEPGTLPDIIRRLARIGKLEKTPPPAPGGSGPLDLAVRW